MAGIIESAKSGKDSEERTEPQDNPAEEKAEGDLSPASVRAQVSGKLPSQLRSAYERVVMAGKKILYSEQMAPQIQQLLQAPGDMGQKLGTGVAALMALLVDKANGTMPPQLILPAATELVAEAGAFLKDAGAKVTDQDIAEGMAVMVETILSKAGVSLDQLPEMLKQQGGAPAPTTAPAPPVSPDGQVQREV